MAAPAAKPSPAFQALTDAEKRAATGRKHGDNVQHEALKNLTPEQRKRVTSVPWT